MLCNDKGDKEMKYIRTKNQIIEIDNNKYSLIKLNGNKLLNVKINEFGGIKREYIIKQADTIKELCDKFAMKTNVSDEPFLLDKISEVKVLKKQIKNYSQIKYLKKIIYGAIWTDKGLIYKAKMKGVLPNGEIDWELL